MTSGNTNTYWLDTWLTSRKITSPAEAAREIAKPSVLRELTSIAEEWAGAPEKAPDGHNLAAGTGLRLNDSLSCDSAKCRKRQIDILFRHAWHYYDSVLIPDASAELLTGEHRVRSKSHLRERLLSQIEVVLHLREMNATGLVHFYRNADLLDAGRNSLPIHLAQTIVGGCRDEAWETVEARLHDPKLYQIHKRRDGGCGVLCHDPGGEVGTTITFSREVIADHDEAWIIASAAHDMLHFHIAALERDVRASRHFNAPLATTVWSHASALSAQNGGPSTSNVLFELQFPTLSQVPVAELLRLRAQEADSFIAFRSALAQAARTMLTERDSDNPKAIADAIRLDIVEPELARLNLKFKGAQRAMRRKTAFTIALTTVATACGLIVDGATGAFGGAGLGLVTSGALATASKFCDTKAEIEGSDMFFLWKALGHAE